VLDPSRHISGRFDRHEYLAVFPKLALGIASSAWSIAIGENLPEFA